MNWDDIARGAGVGRCPSCTGDHVRGYVSRSRGVVHWQDRRFTKAGLRRFLMLASECVLHDYESFPEWKRLWASNTWATRRANMMHVRLPAELSDTDRARVRWLILNEEVPANVTRWANRRLTA